MGNHRGSGVAEAYLISACSKGPSLRMDTTANESSCKLCLLVRDMKSRMGNDQMTG